MFKIGRDIITFSEKETKFASEYSVRFVFFENKQGDMAHDRKPYYNLTRPELRAL
jgi:hypothetical protein